MDPLTHTLVGANLASTRLGERTALAGAALVIGANLPDVDAVLYFTGHRDLALGFRRGWTHGILAIVVLPFVLTALLMLFARLRRISVSPKWLLILSFLAILTHPFLDWLNNYGMRWLMPFRKTWFYGDSVYIMDPFLWLVLGSGWLARRRATPVNLAIWGFFSAALAYVVGQRSSGYLVIVAIVAVLLLVALVWKTNRSLAAAALVVAALYIGARLTIHAATASAIRRQVPNVERVMASPHPIDPLRWEVVAQTASGYRYGRFHWYRGGLTLQPDILPLPADTPEWQAAREHPSIQGFITWMRFPWYEIERTPAATRVLVHDARYAVRRRPGGGFGGVVVELEKRSLGAPVSSPA
ncbi:MAG TPA: metal-dependent hydrolase, partial [Thermoanaerobaculia bacterium]|nr:metal-dependent hydrolase [Thermoanaerobaculia bacterium]